MKSLVIYQTAQPPSGKSCMHDVGPWPSPTTTMQVHPWGPVYCSMPTVDCMTLCRLQQGIASCPTHCRKYAPYCKASVICCNHTAIRAYCNHHRSLFHTNRATQHAVMASRKCSALQMLSMLHRTRAVPPECSDGKPE